MKQSKEESGDPEREVQCLEGAWWTGPVLALAVVWVLATEATAWLRAAVKAVFKTKGTS